MAAAPTETGPSVRAPPAEVVARVRDAGLLLQTDPSGPSAVGLLGGGAAAGSWWARPDGGIIFAGLQVLEHDADIAVFKLLNRKVTFVHRRLWPDIAAVGLSGEPWQTAGLSPDESAVFARVQAAGELSSHDLASAGLLKGTGKAVTGLETRLLLASRQVHTDEGSHARVLLAWPQWLDLVGEKPSRTVQEAKARIEAAVAGVYASAPKPVTPPWIKL